MKLKNRSAAFAWLLSLFCALGATATVIDWFLNQPAPIGLLDILNAAGWQWGFPVLYSAVAALIIARLPRNRVGWLLMLPALANIASLDRFMATPPATLTPALWLFLWFDNWSWIPVIFPIFLIPLHFPSGQPPSPRWRWVNWLAGGLWLFFMLLMAVFDTLGPANFEWSLPNPVGFVPIAFGDGPLLIFWGIGLLITVSGSVASLFVRYRSARIGAAPTDQVAAFAGAIFIVVYAAVYFGSAGGQFGTVSGAMNLLFVLVILAFPAAIGIAILRYQLFDIDVIIRKTVVYGVLLRTAGAGLLWHGGFAAGPVRGIERRAVADCRGHLHAGNCRAFFPAAPAGADRDRPALLS